MPDKRWLPYYGDIPATIPYPDVTLYELFERSAVEHGDQIAVEYLGERLTYRRLKRLVHTAAVSLWTLGVRPGDRLALLLPNTPHAMILLYAANRVGAVVSLFHPESGHGQLSVLVADYRPAWMAVSDEHVGGLMRILSRYPIRGMVICRLDDFGRSGTIRQMRRMRMRFSVDTAGIRGVSARIADTERQTEFPPGFSWRSFLELSGTEEPAAQRELHTPAGLALVLYTGGTTGPPVGVMHADRQLTAVAFQTQVQGPLLAGQSLLCLVSVAHGYGIAAGVHATVSAGAASIMVPHVTTRTLARLIRRRQPEYLVGLPETFSRLVYDRVFRRTRHRHLMGAFCGGDRLPRAVREAFERIVRHRGGVIGIREGYGLTETITACATMPDNDHRHGSVGIPYPDTMIAIAEPIGDDRKPDAGQPVWLACNEVGEVLVCGPTVMSGYLNRDERTKLALQPDGQGNLWLRTGDIGRMDEEGFLYIIDRISRSIAGAEGRVVPGFAEVALNEHVEVLEAYVTVEHAAGKITLTAHVVPADRDRDIEWLESHLRDSLEALEPENRPTRYRFLTNLPRTLAGVVDRQRLAASRIDSDERAHR